MSAGEFSVRPPVLVDLAARWTTVESDVQLAAGTVTSEGPWSPGVSAAVAGFERASRAVLEGVATSAGQASTRLEATSTAYETVDDLVRARFERMGQAV